MGLSCRQNLGSASWQQSSKHRDSLHIHSSILLISGSPGRKLSNCGIKTSPKKNDTSSCTTWFVTLLPVTLICSEDVIIFREHKTLSVVKTQFGINILIQWHVPLGNTLHTHFILSPFWSIDFHHIWTSSPPCRGPAVRQELWSEDYQRFSPGLSSCSPSSESCPPSSSSPRNLEKHATQAINPSPIHLYIYNRVSVFMKSFICIRCRTPSYHLKIDITFQVSR